MAFARLGSGLCVTCLHASTSPPRAEGELKMAAEKAIEWAGDDAPLVFGGDFNVRAHSSDVYEELERDFGLTGITAEDSIDHLLVRNIDHAPPTRAWPEAERELPQDDGRALRLSDHAPVERTVRALDSRRMADESDTARAADEARRAAGDPAPSRASRPSATRSTRASPISRERLQEVVDDAVERGRMTRGDAEELVGRFVARGREQADDIVGQLEAILGQLRDAGTEAAAQPRRTAKRAAGRARRELGDAAERAREEVESRTEKARKRTVAAVEQPLASADRMRRQGPRPGPADQRLRPALDPPDRRPPARPDARGAAEGPRLRAGPQGPEEPAARAGPQAQRASYSALLPPPRLLRRSSSSLASSSTDSSELCARTASLPSSLRTSSVAFSSVSCEGRDLIGRLRGRVARRVAQPSHRRVDARAHVAGRLLAGAPQLVDRLLDVVPHAASTLIPFSSSSDRRIAANCGNEPIASAVTSAGVSLVWAPCRRARQDRSARARACATSSSSRSPASPTAAAASPATTATSSSSAGALPGDTVRAEVTKAKRRFAEARVDRAASARAPTASPTAATTAASPAPERPGRACPTSSSSPTRASRSTTPCAGSAASTASSCSRSSRRPSSGATATSSSTPSARTTDGELVLGFHARGRWDRVVDVEDCMLASERNNAARNEIRDWADRPGHPGLRPPRRARASCATSWSARAGAPGRSRPAWSPRPPSSRSRPSTCTPWSREPAAAPTAPPGALGAEYLEEELCGLRFRISHRAFFQTNTEMAERLYGIAAEAAGLSGTERLFDLFCGIGTMALAMAPSAGEVWGIEVVPDAIVDAEENAAHQRDRERAASAPATPARRSARWSRRPGKPDVVVDRPPARGPLGQGRPARDRVRGEADRLRLLQPDDARPERRTARGGRI